MVSVDLDLTWHTVWMALLVGVAGNLSVLMVSPARGVGRVLGTALFTALLFIGLQAAWGWAMRAVKTDFQPGLVSRRLVTGAVTLGLLLAIFLQWRLATRPGYVWTGEPNLSGAYAAVLVYGGVAFVLGLIAKFVYRKATGSGAQPPAEPADS